jgi:hypothetical protein
MYCSSSQNMLSLVALLAVSTWSHHKSDERRDGHGNDGEDHADSNPLEHHDPVASPGMSQVTHKHNN